MKTIEIVTSHNVSIEYQLATVLDRFLALLIDTVILGVYAFFIMIVVTAFTRGEDVFSIYLTLIMPVALFYHLICEAFFGGQSIGKLAMGIKVVGLNGQNPQISECLMRWIFRTVDLGGTFGVFAALFASASEKGQRLGDTVARTVVIKLNVGNRFTIEEIMNIKDASTHGEFSYPSVTKFTDEDMLLIKNAIERLRMYPNDSHKQLVMELTKKVSEGLGIACPTKNQVNFLKDVLQEYIVLTR